MNQSKEDRQPQRLLAFDTSTSSLAVAVTLGGRVLAERNIYAERNHSAFLVTAISDCLAEAGLTKRELSGIAVGVGPGSYTGTRIAVTTAKTLAWSLKLPVYGVSSLAALALGGWAAASGQDAAALGLLAARRREEPAGAAWPAEAPAAGLGDAAGSDVRSRAQAAPPAGGEGRRYAGGHWIVPLVDARRGQAYTALLGVPAPGGMPERLVPDAIRLMDDWAEVLARRLQELPPQERPAHIWCVGETAKHEASLGALAADLGELVKVVPYELEGEWLGLAAVERSGHPPDDVHALEPNYTQLTEAEVKRQQKA